MNTNDMQEKTPFCSGRFEEGTYSMRGNARLSSDFCHYWSRRIGGRIFDFSHITWKNGSRSILVFNAGTSRTIHEFRIESDAEPMRTDQL